MIKVDAPGAVEDGHLCVATLPFRGELLPVFIPNPAEAG